MLHKQQAKFFEKGGLAMPFDGIERLEKILAKAWTAETSNNSDQWNEGNPSLGQCAVSALVVHHYFGGDILRVEVTGSHRGTLGSHYFNRLPSGITVDLTLQQFPIGITLHNVERRTPKDLLDPAINLKNESTAKRFALLLARVEQFPIDYEPWMDVCLD